MSTIDDLKRTIAENGVKVVNVPVFGLARPTDKDDDAAWLYVPAEASAVIEVLESEVRDGMAYCAFAFIVDEENEVYLEPDPAFRVVEIGRARAKQGAAS